MPTPSLTLAGLAVRRLSHNWPLVLAQLLGVTAAVTLVAGIPLMESAAAEAGLAKSLDTIGLGAAIDIQETHVGGAGDSREGWERGTRGATAKVTQSWPRRRPVN